MVRLIATTVLIARRASEPDLNPILEAAPTIPRESSGTIHFEDQNRRELESRAVLFSSFSTVLGSIESSRYGVQILV